jgi:hypothetical protein
MTSYISLCTAPIILRLTDFMLADPTARCHNLSDLAPKANELMSRSVPNARTAKELLRLSVRC